MTITIKIDTRNAAFTDGVDAMQEVQRMLEEWLSHGVGPRILRDYNGNRVGAITVTGR